MSGVPSGSWWIEADQERKCLLYKGPIMGKNQKAVQEINRGDDQWVVVHLVKGGSQCWLALAKAPELEERACLEIKSHWNPDKVNAQLQTWNLTRTEKGDYTFQKVMDDWKVEYKLAVKAGAREPSNTNELTEEAARAEIEESLVPKAIRVQSEKAKEEEPFGDPDTFPVVSKTKVLEMTPQKVSVKIYS